MGSQTFVYLSGEAQYQQAKLTIAMVTMSMVHQIHVPTRPARAKDLLSVRGYPTTWGAGGFQQQVFTGEDDSIGGPGTPVSLTFLGRLYNDSALLAFAAAYQRATDFLHLQPPGFWQRGVALNLNSE